MKNHFPPHKDIYDRRLLALSFPILLPANIFVAAGKVLSTGPVRQEFIIFGLILVGVAPHYKQTFHVALAGNKRFFNNPACSRVCPYSQQE